MDEDRRCDAQDLVVRFNHAINGRDLAALDALITDEHRFIDSLGTITAGRGPVLAAWRGFFAAFPDYRNQLETLRVDGDRVRVAGRSQCADPRLHGPALWTARVEGGLVAEWRVYDDTAELRARLGL